MTNIRDTTTGLVRRVAWRRWVQRGVGSVGLLAVCATTALGAEQKEMALTKDFCRTLGGAVEVRHTYAYSEQTQRRTGHIRVDCETETHVYEVGLDRRSSFDSVHQALFASLLTHKAPGVVLFDTDGNVGRVEHQIQVLCRALNRFLPLPIRFILIMQGETFTDAPQWSL